MLDAPELRVICLNDSYVYQVEAHYNVRLDQIYTLKTLLKDDLAHLQSMFKKLPPVQEFPYILKKLHFDPELLAIRIVLYTQEYLSQYVSKNQNPKLKLPDHLRLKVELNLHFVDVNDTHGNIGVSIQMPNERFDSEYPLWIAPSEFFHNYLTPVLANGWQTSNEHVCQRAYQFMYPIERVPIVRYETIDRRGHPDVYIGQMFDPVKVIDYYIQWSDKVLYPVLSNQYQSWIKHVPIKIVLDEDQIRSRWHIYRDKIEDHLHVQFNKLRDVQKYQQNYLSIIIHPPDLENLDVDPFLVLEFVEIERKNQEMPGLATTLESTGRTINKHKFLIPPQGVKPLLH